MGKYTRLSLVNAREPNELPDSKPTQRQRESLKRLAGWISLDLDEHELAYLSSCLWDKAEKKREGER
jgi:hypothetical protein